MTTITISGSSDDIVEIGGDIREELYPADVDEFLLGCSDGTVLEGRYNHHGIWRFVVQTKGTAGVSKVEAPIDDDSVYSDVVTLNGDIAWVMMGKSVAR